ncbi:MAG: glycoside hydrolase family 31 protein, partial [Candidatus Cloacimonadaceae bacterium]|nr:glycoside hydrolase family 31 protein [Candidatus Cloacimonadaceae bacterium]
MTSKANPKAQKDAIQTIGKARFTILTGSLIRLEYADNGRFTDDASLVFIHRELPLPEFERYTEGKDIVIRTKYLELRYKTNNGAFTNENLSIRLLNFSPETIWTPGTQDANNLMGTTRTLDETNGATDLTLEQGIISRSGWALIDDSLTPLLDDADWQWVKARSGKQTQDWYFFGYGHRYLEALADYCRVAGKIPMPPRFAFGYWWSRYWAYSDEELCALMADFKRHGLPLDVLVIDMDWHKTEGLSRRNPQTDANGELIGWSGYTWNKDLFPHPAQFIERMHSHGIKIALNLHPASGIAKDEEHYDDFAVRYPRKPHKDGSYPYALEDKRWAQAYFAAIIEPLEREGVDFWWLDWQAWQESRLIAGLSNIWWLNHVFFSHMRQKTGLRPLLFHRWGGLGNHRYQIGFSGDTWISWKSLANLPAFTATAGNVCYGYWSHDIGGHMGGPGSPELYLRWLQYGALSPIMRTHATKDKDLERRVWMFPDHYDAMRDALMLRHALAPYLYGAARKAHDDGVSICRPLYWFHPESEEAYQNPQEYYFGDDIIAAPITHAADDTGLATQTLWLPPGMWYDVCRGALMDGDTSVRSEYALNEIPMFVRAGAIIPLLPEDKAVGEPSDRYILNLYPGADGETVLYEDDGSTDRYLSGEHARTRITQKYAQRGLKILVYPTKGSFEGMPPRVSYQFNVIGRFPPKQVLIGDTVLPYAADLKEGHWSYDGSRLAIRIMLPFISRGKSLECKVIFTAQADARLDHLNGIPGILKRLPEAICVLKKELNRF